MIAQIGPLFYPLIICSFLATILISERIIFFAKLSKLSVDQDYLKLTSLLNKNKKLTKDIRDEIISTELVKIKEKLEFGLRFLRMIAMLTPMIGLLGTIIGIIDSFKVIATINEAISPAIIADGLWEAMLTTAFGLAIAIVILFVTFIFARIAEKRIMQFQTNLNNLSLEMAGVKYSD